MKKIISDKRILPQLALLLVIVSILSVAIISFVNGSLGWFASNLDVYSEQQNINMDKFDAVAQYFVYIYDSKESTSTDPVIHYTGEGLENDPSITNLDMQFYDTIFRSRNRYTPAIIRIELSELQKTTGDVEIVIKRNSEFQTRHTTTNAIRFTIAQSNEWYSQNAEDIFTVVDSSLYPLIAINEDYSIGNNLDINGNTFRKGNSQIFTSDTITLSVPFAETDIVSGILNIYLYLSYDIALVDSFEISGITGGSTIGQIFDLENDIAELKINIR